LLERTTTEIFTKGYFFFLKHARYRIRDPRTSVIMVIPV